MKIDNKQLEKLFKRVYNNEMYIDKVIDDKTYNDPEHLVTYMNSLYSSDRYEQEGKFWQFNDVLVKMAEEIARPAVTELLGILADVQRVTGVNSYEYVLPKKFKSTVVWSANGASADHVRLDNRETKVATPMKLQTGYYYEMSTLRSGDLEMIRTFVDGIAKAKIDKYMEMVTIIMRQAMADGRIPAKNVLTGANLTLKQYNQLASVLARYGGRPVFFADSLLIDKFANAYTTETGYDKLLTDSFKTELRESLQITRIGRTDAVSFVNPFIENTGNTKVQLPVNEGYMFAGNVGLKPFKVIEFDSMKQFTEVDYNIERVTVKLNQSVAIEFVQGDAVGYVKDDSVAL